MSKVSLRLFPRLRSVRTTLDAELSPMLRLSVPVVLGELSWMSMGVVDTMMVGRLSPEAIGAVSLGTLLFFTVGIFAFGLLLGLDTLVPQAFGAGSNRDCQHALAQAVFLSALLSPPAVLAMLAVLPLLGRWGIHPDVVALTEPYTVALAWSAPPLLFFTALRQYLQGMNRVRPVMVVLITVNLVNVAANWVLIFGNLGFPALGVAGAGWASVASRVYLFAGLAAYAWRNRAELDLETAADAWRWRGAMMRRLVVTGAPAALQRLLEVGVFALATALIGRLEPVALAAHQVALNAASVTFMVPLGISTAAAVRVGQSLGRADAAGARRAGWTALLLGGGFMALAGIVFWLGGRWIVLSFSDDPEVISTGASLLIVAAVFQLSDGIQVVATGALRGAGDTRVPMAANLVAHWLLGLPAGYYLCFERGWGATGIWAGLSLGLTAVGAVLLYVWARLSASGFAAVPAAPVAAEAREP